jgi:antitoxin component of MazEF toxin-antitoxin module
MTKLSSLKPARIDRGGNVVGYQLRKTGGSSLGVTIHGTVIHALGLEQGDTLFQFLDRNGNIVLMTEDNYRKMEDGE